MYKKTLVITALMLAKYVRGRRHGAASHELPLQGNGSSSADSGGPQDSRFAYCWYA